MQRHDHERTRSTTTNSSVERWGSGRSPRAGELRRLPNSPRGISGDYIGGSRNPAGHIDHERRPPYSPSGDRLQEPGSDAQRAGAKLCPRSVGVRGDAIWPSGALASGPAPSTPEVRRRAKTSLSPCSFAPPRFSGWSKAHGSSFTGTPTWGGATNNHRSTRRGLRPSLAIISPQLVLDLSSISPKREQNLSLE